MDKEELLSRITSLIDKWESENNNSPVGCYVDFTGEDGVWEWDGEQMSFRAEGQMGITIVDEYEASKYP